jgi:type IV secretion system protein VirD4
LYTLSRLILITALAVYGYCIVLTAMLFTPYSWWVLLALGLAAARKRKTLINLTGAHGTAYWAGEPELENARMINGKPGRLPLGKLISTVRGGFLSALEGVMNFRKANAKQACRQFFAALKRKKTAPLVRLPPATVNSVCFAPVGAGKSTGLCIPFLLECEDSAIVIDFKGELALATALHRKRMGHEIAIFDPYGVITQ